MKTPPAAPIVTLLSDFGNRDHYVAVMKGVIAQIAPDARVIDISHEVEPFQIAQAAYLLSQAWLWFPPGTVHVAVVDPGVGTARRPLAVQALGHRFILPDNGILSALDDVPELEAREIQNPRVTLSPISRTFHGRDVFAPAAAQLAAGFPFEEIGPPVLNWVRFGKNAQPPSVLHIDRFGNIVTSLKPGLATPLSLRGVAVHSRHETYGAASPGELFVISGSGGYLEISLREGSAAAMIGCQVGDPIYIDR